MTDTPPAPTFLVETHGIDVIAEGVENAATVALLQEMGCDQAQGCLQFTHFVYFCHRYALVMQQADDMVSEARTWLFRVDDQPLIRHVSQSQALRRGRQR